jgi:UDP-glucose 4-epimerase
MAKKIVLVFGATGTTGVYTVDYFTQHLDPNEFEVVPTSRRDTDYYTKRGYRYCRCDIENASDFDNLPTENVYAIVHLAAMLPSHMEGYHPERYIDVNIKGTLNVLEYAKRVKADRILFMKSIADYYGYLKEGMNFFPTDMRPKINYMTDHCVYAISKIAACELIENYHQMYGLKGFIFRMPNIYSYHPRHTYYVNGVKKPMGYRYVIDQAVKGAPIEVWGDVKKGRDLVYVKDFAQILYRGILADCDGGEFNVGSGRLTPILEHFQTIVDVFSPADHKSELIMCPDKKDSANYWMDIEKTKRVLGYEPQYNCRAYLEDYKKEMANNRFEGLY